MDAVSCAVHWSSQQVLIGVTVDVLCKIEAVEMDASARPTSI